jgi:hypothetical protein
MASHLPRALLIFDVLDHTGGGDGVFSILPLACLTDTGNADIGEEPASKGDDGVNDQWVQYCFVHYYHHLSPVGVQGSLSNFKGMK